MLGNLTPGGFAPGGSFTETDPGTLRRIDLPTFVMLNARDTAAFVADRVTATSLDPQETSAALNG